MSIEMCIRSPLTYLGRGSGRAPKGRKTHSLGRQPQVQDQFIEMSPEGATDWEGCLHGNAASSLCLSPLRGWLNWSRHPWG